MTTLDVKKQRHGFFSIYKPGQGKWVRWGTVAALAVVVLAGTYYIAVEQLATKSPAVQAGVGAVWTLLGAILTFWLVNNPRLAEFMIMTESEMRKVAWPSRREVIASTKIVIILTLLLGFLLYLVDVGFLAFFKAIGIA